MNIAVNKHNLVKVALSLYLLIFAIFPTGIFEWLKVLSLALAGGSFLYILIHEKIRIPLQLLVGTLGFFSILLIALTVSSYKGFFYAGSLLEFRSITLLLISVSIFIAAQHVTILDYRHILKVVLLGHLLYIVLKVTVTLMVFGIGDSDAATEFLKSISENLSDAGSLGMVGLIRIASSSDPLSIPLFFLLLLEKQVFNKYLRTFILVFLLFNIVFSFSRFGWASFLVLLLIHLLLNFRIKYLVVYLFCFATAFSAVWYANEYTNLKMIDAVVHRLTAEGSLSTDVKKEQIPYLMAEVEQHLFIGKGLGGYSENYLRTDSEVAKYGYEVFWLVLWFQFGTFFLLAVVAYLSLPIKNIVLNLKSSRCSFLVVLYMFFLANGFVNPTLIGASNVVIFVLFYTVTSNKESVGDSRF